MQVSRGDTIIEIVLAFAIFSAAAVGTMTVLSSGVATTQRDLESTLVREQIDTQTEMLRYIKDTKDPVWQTLVSSAISTPLPLNDSCEPVGSISQGFYVQPVIDSADPTQTKFVQKTITSATYVTPQTYAKIDYAGGANQSQGLWIQVTKSQQNGPIASYDFYIHACWNSAGLHVPMTLGTIVRIYD